jgi:hypothetical protein
LDCILQGNGFGFLLFLQYYNPTSKKIKKDSKTRLLPAPAAQYLSRSSPTGFEKNIFLNTKKLFLKPHPSLPIIHPQNIFLKNLDRLPLTTSNIAFFFLFVSKFMCAEQGGAYKNSPVDWFSEQASRRIGI